MLHEWGVFNFIEKLLGLCLHYIVKYCIQTSVLNDDMLLDYCFDFPDKKTVIEIHDW